MGGLAFRLFFDTRIDTFLQMLLDWPLHIFAIYPSYNDYLSYIRLKNPRTRPVRSKRCTPRLVSWR